MIQSLRPVFCSAAAAVLMKIGSIALFFAGLILHGCDNHREKKAKTFQAYRIVPQEKKALENPLEVAVLGPVCTHSISLLERFDNQKACIEFIDQKNTAKETWETFECSTETPVCNR